MAMMMAMTISAHAMSFSAARNEALFLSDKMAYELNLTDAHVYGNAWSRRNTDLQYVLTAYQYNKYVGLNYFYRPMTWKNGAWTFHVYSHYTNKNHFYKARPKTYASYKGGTKAKTNHNGSVRGNPATRQDTKRPDKKDNMLAHHTNHDKYSSHRGR